MSAHLATRDAAQLFPRPSDRRGALQEDLEEFYARRGGTTAWDEDAARSLLAGLGAASLHGIDPDAYDREELAVRVDRSGGDLSVPLDAALSATFLQYASDLAYGFLDRDERDDDWHYEPPSVDLVQALRLALERGEIAQWLAALAPDDPGYRDLQRLLVEYGALAGSGTFGTVPDGPTLHEGDRADRVRLEALVRRLRAENDLSAGEADLVRESWDAIGAAPPLADEARAIAAGPATAPASIDSRPVYGGPLVTAVTRFQDRHGIRVDGVVGPGTTAALNATPAERVRTILINLERWRWLRDQDAPRWIRVNIADQRLEAFENGEPVLEMNVVVGRESWPTPVFSDRMTHVVVNPYWNVPTSIASAEIAPKALANPGYAGSRSYQILDASGSAVQPTPAAWRAVSSGRYRVRQLPGADNALGRIKFLFPNRFAVYLHDTPSKSLFDSSERAQSHGCVRVERPLDLARFVLGPRGAREVEHLWKTGAHERIDLAEPVRVQMRYITALVDDGRPHFLEDLYGHDRELAEHFPLRRAAERSDGAPT